MSSINNISKNSFEEVDKNDQIASNYYLAKTPTVQQSSTQQPSSGSAKEGANGFYFMKSSTNQSSSNQQSNTLAGNTSIGNFEIEKDLKEDNFEEITESKDIIEDRINRIKSVMIDHTMKQQDLSEKIQNLQKDIELL